jgi:hypothetical protein
MASRKAHLRHLKSLASGVDHEIQRVALVGDVALRVRDLIRDICGQYDVSIMAYLRTGCRPPRRRANSIHSIRHGERSAHVFSAPVAHVVVLSAWQTLQAFGIFWESVIAG